MQKKYAHQNEPHCPIVHARFDIPQDVHALRNDVKCLRLGSAIRKIGAHRHTSIRHPAEVVENRRRIQVGISSIPDIEVQRKRLATHDRRRRRQPGRRPTAGRRGL